MKITSWITVIITTAVLSSNMFGQPAARRERGFGPRGPQVVSPEVSPDRNIAFRILAPNADSVRLIGSDIPGNGQGTNMTKGTNGVWEVTVGPIDPGAYRYNFNVDQLAQLSQ